MTFGKNNQCILFPKVSKFLMISGTFCVTFSFFVKNLKETTYFGLLVYIIHQSTSQFTVKITISF